MLVINPDECIDCALCEPECPIDAIYSEDEVPDNQLKYIELNAELCMEWPNIVEQKDPLPDSDQWKEVEDKFEMIERQPFPRYLKNKTKTTPKKEPIKKGCGSDAYIMSID